MLIVGKLGIAFQALDVLGLELAPFFIGTLVVGGFGWAGRNADFEGAQPDQFLFRAKYRFDCAEETARYALEFTVVFCGAGGQTKRENRCGGDSNPRYGFTRTTV